MYCSNCHYGSETCKLQETGKVIVTSTEFQGKIVKSEVNEVKCPQCGCKAAPLLMSPFNHKKGFSKIKTHKQTRKQQHNTIDDHQDIEDATSGHIRAVDYTRNK